jgi:ABC-type nitrate/sulfonate/bicarbonate transport system permease component
MDKQRVGRGDMQRLAKWLPFSLNLGAITREMIFWVVSPLLAIIVWELLSQFGIWDRRIFIPPHKVVVSLWTMTVDGELLKQVGITIARFTTGFFVGGIPGLFIGVTMGLFRTPRAILNPLVSAVYPIPRVALFPLVLIVLGLNEFSSIVMVAIGPFFAMLISARSAVLNIEPVYLDVAKSFRCGKRDLYRRIVIPAALPVIFGGIQIALGMTLMGTIAAEFLVADSGLGYMIWHSWQLLALDVSMVGLVATALIGFGTFALSDLMQKKLIPWE